MMQEKRRFVPKLDFVTSPGYLDGSPQARETAGLPAQTGPYPKESPVTLEDRIGSGSVSHTPRRMLRISAPSAAAR